MSLTSDLAKVCSLQRHYSAENTAEMQARGQIVRGALPAHLRLISTDLARGLGAFGGDLIIEASDGIGRKTELPWIRFASKRMSPRPTEGFYCVTHFSTDGTAFHITIGCGSSKFSNGSSVPLPDVELDRQTSWARSVVLRAAGTLSPFLDHASFGARRKLPVSFERATAMSARVDVDFADDEKVKRLYLAAAEFLRVIYEAQVIGGDMNPADQAQILLESALSPAKARRGPQGFGLTPEERSKVELRAMLVATEWLIAQGYRVTDRSASSSFDLLASNATASLKVEVKGTTSDAATAILMTRNEVDLHRAENGRTALLLVSSIRLLDAGGGVQAAGGVIEPFMNWNIDEWKIEATSFRVSRP